MQQNGSRCYRLVDGILICSKCSIKVVKNGKNSTGNQRYCCKRCGYSKVFITKYKAYNLGIDSKIVKLTKEGCGIRSTSRILEISPLTVIRKICKIANQIVRPFPIYFGKSYQMDELFTYVGNKDKRICIAYSLEEKTGNVIDFVVGRRNKKKHCF